MEIEDARSAHYREGPRVAALKAALEEKESELKEAVELHARDNETVVFGFEQEKKSLRCEIERQTMLFEEYYQRYHTDQVQLADL